MLEKSGTACEAGNCWLQGGKTIINHNFDPVKSVTSIPEHFTLSHCRSRFYLSATLYACRRPQTQSLKFKRVKPLRRMSFLLDDSCKHIQSKPASLRVDTELFLDARGVSALKVPTGGLSFTHKGPLRAELWSGDFACVRLRVTKEGVPFGSLERTAMTGTLSKK